MWEHCKLVKKSRKEVIKHLLTFKKVIILFNIDYGIKVYSKEELVSEIQVGGK